MSAQLVARCALLGIFEGVVRFADFLEFVLAAFVFGDVRMVLVREFSIRLLDLVSACAALYAQYRVVILVFHSRDDSRIAERSRFAGQGVLRPVSRPGSAAQLSGRHALIARM